MTTTLYKYGAVEISISVGGDVTVKDTSLFPVPVTVMSSGYSELTQPPRPYHLPELEQFLNFQKGLIHYVASLIMLNMTDKLHASVENLFDNDKPLDQALIKYVLTDEYSVFSVALAWLRYYREAILTSKGLDCSSRKATWMSEYYTNYPVMSAMFSSQFVLKLNALVNKVAAIENAVAVTA